MSPLCTATVTRSQPGSGSTPDGPGPGDALLAEEQPGADRRRDHVHGQEHPGREAGEEPVVGAEVEAVEVEQGHDQHHRGEHQDHQDADAHLDPPAPAQAE
jgi:hypothetical protein